jgi:uncharacterized membrane protein
MSSQTSEHSPKPRIQSLSDLIFGLALSISALTLVGQQPTSVEQASFALGLYAFSFLVLISVWRLYSSITSLLPAETSFLVNLNIVLLFFVSIEPYLFNELFAQGGVMYRSFSGLYGLDLSAMFFIIAYFDHSLAKEERKLVPKTLLGLYRSDRNFTLLIAALFAISVYPYFGDTILFMSTTGGATYDFTIRSVLWLVALFSGWGRRAVRSFRKTQ